VRILGVDLSTETVAVPCLSEVPEDPKASLAEEGLQTLSIDRRLGGAEGSFFLKASRGALALLGVEDGDLVLVAPVTLAGLEDGAVVLARTGGDTVFHRARQNGRGWVLESLGPSSERVLIEDPGAVSLLGRVAGFYRRMDEAGIPAPTKH
jgi:SOS-response transcriptional repressor LexA